MARKVVLVDTSLCTGCRGCQIACKNWNKLPAEETAFTGSYENPPSLSAKTWTRVMFNEVSANGKVNWFFAKSQCMHCTDAICMSVCPANAIYRTSLDTVARDFEKCIGCGMCASNCPFGIPQIDAEQKKMFKCFLCFDRVSNGMVPACVQACATGALKFGEQEEMIAVAEEKVAKLKSDGYANACVYGVDELEGTGFIYVFADNPSTYGFPDTPVVSLSAHLWKIAMRPVKALAAIGITLSFLGGIKDVEVEKKQEKE